PRRLDLALLAARVARLNDRLDEAHEHPQKCSQLQGGISEPLKLERMMLTAQTGEVETVVESLYEYLRRDHPATPQILEALCFGFRRARGTGPAVRCAGIWLGRGPDNLLGFLCHGARSARPGGTTTP